jgi:hypothetical protein
MVAALRAQPGGGVVSDQLPATLAALVGGGLRACGCLLNAAAAPGGIGGSVFRLTVDDAGALAAAREAASATAGRRKPAGRAAAGAAVARGAESARGRKRKHSSQPSGASGCALLALLADPSLTALPGPIAGRARGPGGVFIVHIVALFSAGLRAARERGLWLGADGGRSRFSQLMRERFGVVSRHRKRGDAGLVQCVYLIPATATSVADWLRGRAGRGGAATDWPLPDIVAAAPT